jgi:hypothetical protein
MAAKPKKEPSAKGHSAGAVTDKPVAWPMATATGRANYPTPPQVPVVKTATVGHWG